MKKKIMKSYKNIMVDHYRVCRQHPLIEPVVISKRLESIINNAHSLAKNHIHIMIVNKSFEDINFDYANLANIIFCGCNFSNCSFKKAAINYCEFYGCTFDCCGFIDTFFNKSMFGNFKRSYPYHYYGQINIPDRMNIFEDCNFEDSIFSMVTVFYTKFQHSNFSHCEFTSTAGLGTNIGPHIPNNDTAQLLANDFPVIFLQCNMHHMTFGPYARFTGAIFKGSTLRYSRIYKSDIRFLTITDCNDDASLPEKMVKSDFSDNEMVDTSINPDCELTAKQLGISINRACPSEGSFIGWKKIVVSEFRPPTPYRPSTLNSVFSYTIPVHYLIKLEIPEDAKRSSSTSNKCRCDKAKVLEIYVETKKGKYVLSKEHKVTNIKTLGLGNSIAGGNGPYVKNRTVYEIGEYVYPDSFDENPLNECSNGIHFFVSKEEAINYKLC